MMRGTDEMKISGDKGVVVLDWKGRRLRFPGEMCCGGPGSPYFIARLGSAEWLPPFDGESVGGEELRAYAAEAHRLTRGKLRFTDENGRKIGIKELRK